MGSFNIKYGFCRHILTKHISSTHTSHSLKFYNVIRTWIWAMWYVISLGLFTATFRTSLPVNLKVFWKWPNLWSIFSVLPMKKKKYYYSMFLGQRFMWKKCPLWELQLADVVTSFTNLVRTVCLGLLVSSKTQIQEWHDNRFLDSIPFWFTVIIVPNIFITLL
jgi:hypothetical protein